MISFYDMWLRLDELTDISKIDSSNIVLDRSGPGSYHYFSFKHDGEDFRVEAYLDADASRKVNNLSGKDFSVWSIYFKGKRGMSLTGTSGGGAVGVYSKLLGSIKKLTEIDKVDGLTFSGQERSMDIMYDKFIKMLGGFKPVGNETYMRTELLSGGLKDKAEEMEKINDKWIASLKANKDEQRAEKRASMAKAKDMLKNPTGEPEGFDGGVP
jgi:hypothetical protein